MSKQINTNREELRKALKLWYEEHGEQPDEFETIKDGENYSEAVDTLIKYMNKVKENE